MAKYRLIDYNPTTGERIISYYDTSADAKTCACGCHTPLPKKSRSDRKYLNEAHRKRAARARTTPKARLCPCGCGKTVEGPRKRFFGPSCRVRHHRAIKAEEREACL